MCKGVCMLMNTVPEEAIGIRSLGAGVRSYREPPASMWVLATKLRLSVRAASIFSC